MNSVCKIENEFYDKNLALEIVKKNKVNEVMKDLGTCPRSVDEVYSMGIKIQNFLGDIYGEILTQPGNNATCQAEVNRQMVIKERVQQLANNNLNQLLNYFYNNGGPIIEPPVSEQAANDIQSFFGRTAKNALTQMVELTDWNRESSPEEAAALINTITINMYEAMSKLYAGNDEVKAAFEELMELQRI